MKNKHEIGIFHRKGSAVQFDPVDRAAKLKRFIDWYSDQSFDVRGFSYEGKEYTGGKTWARGDISKFIAQGGTDGFDPYYRHILGGKSKSGGRCGEAEHGGNESVAFSELAGCGDKTTIHEWLHNGLGDYIGDGFGHSHILRNGAIDKMGDNTSVMGSNDHIVGMISPHICEMGWNRTAETLIPDKSCQVLIAPVEMQGLHDNEFKHVILKVKGFNDFFLSTRLDYPYSSGSEPADKLYVNELCPNGCPDVVGDYPVATVRHEDMTPGDARELPNGILVQYVGYEKGIARVNVVFNQDYGFLFENQNLTLPTTGKPIASGSYFQPVSDGHGLFIFANGEDVSVYWYTGNEDNDYPRWHMAYGTKSEELPLYTTEGGTIQNPTLAVEKHIGSCRVSDGLFTWSFFIKDKDGKVIDNTRGGIELTQIIKATGGGVFYFPDRKGEGACVLFYDDVVTGEKSCAVFLFTYGPKDILAANSTQRWYAGVGSGGYMADYGSRYLLNFYQTRGRFQSGLLKTAECGNGYLIDVNENTIILGFAIDGRDETYTMVRLV